MKKALSLVLSLLMLLSILILPAHADDAGEPTVYGPIGLQMVEPEGFREAGFQVLYNDSLLNIVLNTESSQHLMTIIFRLTEAELAYLQQDGSLEALADAGMRTLGELDGCTYLMLHVGDAPGNVNKYYTQVLGMDFDSLPESEQNQVTKALPLLSQAIVTLEMVPVSNVMGGIFDFSTTDLDGNPVSSDIFTEKDLTIINVWGTFCGSCISEMPELAQWNNTLPDNVQIIGIISDVPVGGDTTAARHIISNTGVTYKNLLYNNTLMPLLSQCQYVPTTYFVDGKGNMVAEPIVGANTAGYKAVVEQFLAQ